MLRQSLLVAVKEYDLPLSEVELSYPNQSFGDYSTNLALKLAKTTGVSPRVLAKDIAAKLESILHDLISEVSVAGPGFINIRLNDASLIEEMTKQPEKTLKGKVIVTEFSDPNPFKLLHAGHLYTSIVGDAIANLLTEKGARVFRVNFGGDVGLHVGKAIWAMIRELGGENPDRLRNIPPVERSQWMSQAYVAGNAAYEDHETAKREIIEINQRVYAIQDRGDKRSALARIYWTTRQWSYDYFNEFYDRLHIHFDRFYPESETVPVGLAIVKEQLKHGVFESSNGAVVFRGERFGLHTRVFINSNGLPTYETKDLGLAELKRRDYNYDRSIIITANEQQQYMRVVYKALEQFDRQLALSTTHLTHGIVRLSGGKKMSSRTGNILRAEDILDAAEAAVKELSDKPDNRLELAAVKYSMLKQRLGGDIIYEPKESVNVLGNSGPYLQYAHARARSILAKATGRATPIKSITPTERLLALTLSRYKDVVNQASSELSPHILCSYLFETAQVFNRFYESNRVIGDEREGERLKLVEIYADKLKSGLRLLGIEAPARL